MNPEQALLGAVLSGVDLGDLSKVVTGRDFHQPIHEQIWDACHRVYESGGKPDPLTVRAAIGPEANEFPGGALYLTELMQSCPALTSARAYADEVADIAWRRRMHSTSIALGQLAASERDRAEVLEDARHMVDEMSDPKNTAVSFADSLQTVIDQASSGGTPHDPSPWPDVDRIIKGLAPGRLYVIGARPGTGKSLAGGNVAAQIARAGKSALIASMEMSHAEITARMIACEAKVSLSDIESGTIRPNEWEHVAIAHSSMSQWAIQIEDGAMQTVATIRARVRDLARTSDLGVVVVDYLQLLAARDTKINRAEQVAEMSRGLKGLAREFDVPVVAMAQLNREGVRTNRRPTMVDLRESGAIEQDADVVMLMHREDEQMPDVTVIVVKNRAGFQGECTLQLQGHYGRLVSTQRWSA